MSMKCRVTPVVICLFIAVSCSPLTTATPGPAATPTLLPTAAPIIATPPPGPTIALHAYMQLVHERVLPEYARRVAVNRDLLSAASSSGFDADALCPGPESGSWQHFDDLLLEASAIVAPPWADSFHTALTEALAAAEESAQSYEWFCATYAAFGQPAEGMWGRLSLQVRACQARIAELRSQWDGMGGEAMGLLW
jgi:hypothetical protein